MTNAADILQAAIDVLNAEAPPDIEFSEPVVTEEVAFRMFQDAVKLVWKSDKLKKVRFDYQVKDFKDGVLASLSHERKYKPTAFGDRIIESAPHYRLHINPKLLTLPASVVRSIMVHEAVHVGHPNHGAEFLRVVKKYHGAASENMAMGGKYKLMRQPAPRKRFVVLTEYDTIEEARTAMNKHAAEREPGVNYQIRY